MCDLEDECKKGCFCTHKIDIPFNKTIRFVFSTAGVSINNRRFAHPIHLHGHTFHVVAAGYGMYNETTGESIEPTKDIECAPGSNNRICIKPTWRDGREPNVTIDEYTVRKDSVILPGLSYLIVHFKSTNPGWWLLHCHIELHQHEGMALLVNEALERQPPPPAGMCEPGNFTWTVEDFNKALQFEYTPTSSIIEIPSTTLQPVPTQTVTPSPSSREEEDDELSIGAVAGIAVGVAVFIALFVLAILMVAIIISLKGKNVKEKKQDGGKTTKDASAAQSGGEEIEMQPTEAAT